MSELNPLTFIFEESTSQRLDKYLTQKGPDLSRSRIQALIKNGFVTINSKVITKTGTMLINGQIIGLIIPPNAPTDLVPEDIPLTIIYESDDVLVINKPAGMVVHPSIGHSKGTLIHAVLAYIPEIEGVGGVLRPGIVHRLDKHTSGAIILAKNDNAHHLLQQQFKDRETEKTYIALVDGKPPTPTGRIEVAIQRDPSKRKKMAPAPKGKGREATSIYRTLKSYSSYTLLEVKPITGRTHQIRVHMAYLKCPIVGDSLYGRKSPSIKLGRFFLHAKQLQITLPNEKEPTVFNADLPVELEEILLKLR